MQHWTCPRGHQGECAANGARPSSCPVCGVTLLTSSDSGTLLTRMHGGATGDMQATQPPEAAVWTEGTERPRVPGYELLGELGRGGMGVVYKALQVRLNRVVALKMVLSGAHAGPEELLGFRLEAESVAQLQHPHVVQIHDVGEAEGRAYLSLEFIDGGSLAERLMRGRPTPEEAARLVATLARAMHAAHQRGIIHRDLKPANILLTADGQPKINDFGLAKRYADSSGPTASQAIMGTPSYMAPEQAGGRKKDIGPAADIYALGAILYECLTGRPPFAAETPLDTVLQLTTEEPPPPRRLTPRCPRPLETICLKCLEKLPKNRYASALALAEDLERHLNGEPILARPVGPVGRFFRWCRRQPALAATVIGLSLFYLNHVVLMFGFGIDRSHLGYHWFVTATLAAWMAAAWGFQQVVRRPRWEQAGTLAWACVNVCFFTLILWRGNGPQSSLLAGYLLMTAAAALHGRVILVWAVTILGIAGYLGLEIHARVWRPEVAVKPYQSFIFVLFLAMMGLLLHLLLRRTRPERSV